MSTSPEHVNKVRGELGKGNRVSKVFTFKGIRKFKILFSSLWRKSLHVTKNFMNN